MARFWIYAPNPGSSGLSVSLAGNWMGFAKTEGAGSEDYYGSLSTSVGSVSTVRPVRLYPTGPDYINFAYVGSDSHYFRCEDRGTVTVTDPKPAVTFSPEQSFLVDTIKDSISFGAGYMASRAGISGLASALTGAGVATGLTIASGVATSIPPLLVGGAVILASQIALNYAQVALSTPASPATIKVKSDKIWVRFNPDTGVNYPDSSPSSSSSGSPSSPIPPTNYDITSQFFDSFPSWNSGQRHQLEGQLINAVGNTFKDIIKDSGADFTPTQENDFDNSDFWLDFKNGIRGIIETTTAKRANDSYKNDLNEISKSLSKISISLADIDFPDFPALFKTYFSVPDVVSSNPGHSIAKLFKEKDFSSSYIVVEGGEY